MTSKERAVELVYKMIVHDSTEIKWAKKCALVAVDFAIDAIADCSVVAGYPLDEYKKIKEEINKL